MNNNKIFIFMDKKKRNYYTESETSCNKCGKKLSVKDAFFFVSEYSPNMNRQQALCLDCEKKYKPIGVVCEEKLVFIVSGLPNSVIPFFPTPPRLKSFSGETAFSAVNRDTEITIDKTKFAERDLLEKDNETKRLEKK